LRNAVISEEQKTRNKVRLGEIKSEGREVKRKRRKLKRKCRRLA
jgi:hypothetical protein